MPYPQLLPLHKVKNVYYFLMFFTAVKHCIWFQSDTSLWKAWFLNSCSAACRKLVTAAGSDCAQLMSRGMTRHDGEGKGREEMEERWFRGRAALCLAKLGSFSKTVPWADMVLNSLCLNISAFRKLQRRQSMWKGSYQFTSHAFSHGTDFMTCLWKSILCCNKSAIYDLSEVTV